MLSPLLLQVTTPKYSKRFQQANKGKWTSRDMMAAILFVKGPVCNYTTATHYGPQFLRHMSIKQFNSTCKKLQQAGFGAFHGKTFVKKFPSEAMVAVGENTDLLTADAYTNKFYMPVPRCFTLAMCEKLIGQGHVTKDHFHWGLTSDKNENGWSSGRGKLKEYLEINNRSLPLSGFLITDVDFFTLMELYSRN